MLKLWLSGVLMCVIGTGGLLAQADSASRLQSGPVASEGAAKLPVWDVVSVHPADPNHCTAIRTVRYSPDGMNAVCEPLLSVIQQAYALLQPTLILGAPEWVKTGSLWNINAKVAAGDAATYTALKPSDKYRMMRSALADRFQMKAHMERKEIPVYDLVVAKGGPKLRQATADDAAKGHLWMRELGDLEVIDGAISSLPLMLNAEVGRAIVDKTDLVGHYDFTLKYMPAAKTATDETGGPSIFTAIQEQLGLKLQPSKALMDVLVIDSIERPTTN